MCDVRELTKVSCGARFHYEGDPHPVSPKTPNMQSGAKVLAASGYPFPNVQVKNGFIHVQGAESSTPTHVRPSLIQPPMDLGHVANPAICAHCYCFERTYLATSAFRFHVFQQTFDEGMSDSECYASTYPSAGFSKCSNNWFAIWSSWSSQPWDFNLDISQDSKSCHSC